MAFGQPSAFGSFGTSGFSGTGSGAAKQPTNPFGTGTGFGATGGGMGTGVWNPTAPGSPPPPRTTQTQLPFDRDQAFTPESGMGNMNPTGQYRETIPEGYMINPDALQQMQNAKNTGMITGVWHPYYIRDPNYVAPGTSPAPAPTSPTSPTGPGTGTGTGTGTGSGYGWADLLGNMFGGGGGRSMGLSGSNMSINLPKGIQAEQSLVSALNGIYGANVLDNLPRLQELATEYGVGLPDFQNQHNFSLVRGNEATWDRAYGDWKNNILHASASRLGAASREQQAQQQAAKRAREHASTTGITLPFPA